jgi:hypothetical protein
MTATTKETTRVDHLSMMGGTVHNYIHIRYGYIRNHWQVQTIAAKIIPQRTIRRNQESGLYSTHVETGKSAARTWILNHTNSDFSYLHLKRKFCERGPLSSTFNELNNFSEENEYKILAGSPKGIDHSKT